MSSPDIEERRVNTYSKKKISLSHSLGKMGMYADVKSMDFCPNLELEGKLDYFYSPYNKNRLHEYYMKFDEVDEVASDDSVGIQRKEAQLSERKTTLKWK
jgi:hypothetical protein